MPFLGDPMKYFLAITILLFNIAKASASDVTDSSIIEINLSNKNSISLDSFLWEKRPIIVFSNGPQDPSFVTQLNYLLSRLDSLKERDVVILTDTNPNLESAPNTTITIVRSLLVGTTGRRSRNRRGCVVATTTSV